MMKIIVYGSGNMGKKIVQAVINNKDMELIGIVSSTFDKTFENNMYHSLKECYQRADIVIDFSHPSHLNDILYYAQYHHSGVVLGTTGYTQRQLLYIQKVSSQIPIFQSYNMSYGMTLLSKIIKSVCQDFYTHGYDIEIIEKHHHLKKDAPSGTALYLYQLIAEEIQNIKPIYDRTQNQRIRKKDEVGIHSIRAGNFYGEHTVLFAGNNEVFEIKHTALSQDIFVQGAIQASYYILGKENGLYR